jgi:hypothetical protein
MYFNSEKFAVCYSQIHAINHRKLLEDINRWFIWWMITWYVVDCDMAYSG